MIYIIEVFVKRKLPENIRECGDLNCYDCAMGCAVHSDTPFGKRK